MGDRPGGMPSLAAKLEAERKLKEGIAGHKTGLPKKLLELFEPRKPLDTLSAIRHKKPALAYSGIAELVSEFAEPGQPEYEPGPEEGKARPASPRRFRNPELAAQARVDQESRAEKRLRIFQEQKERAAYQIEEGLQSWEPAKDPSAQGDPFKTLFVARLSHDVTEKKIKQEFEEYGPIKRVRLVHDKNTEKPRGYAFIEYERKEDMKTAYKLGDGRKLEGKRVTVDVERGRTVPNWRPRRLGGGKGGESRLPKEPKSLAKRMAAALLAGALPGAPPGLPAAPTPAAAAAPPSADRDREREREREREKEKERERVRERERGERERGDRERAEREKGEREKGERERAERERRDKERERPRERERERSDKERERPRERDGEKPRDRERERDKDRERRGERGERSDRKRERDPREDRNGTDRPRDRDRERERGEIRGSDDGRSSKRAREDGSGRRRERDML